MKTTADVIVVGQGAYGIAATYQLAKSGLRVIGLDQSHIAHERGSSHGGSRITRHAIGERAAYSPFALRSTEIWKELEARYSPQRPLYKKTGGLLMATEGEPMPFHGRRGLVQNTIAAANVYSVPHEVLDADEIRRRFPLFHVRDNEIGYYEPEAGVIFPENCLFAHYHAALNWGAKMYTCQVESVKEEGGEVVVQTSFGEMRAKHCIIAAGPWTPRFLPESYRKNFKIIRQIMFWFRPSKCFAFDRMPIYISEREGIYGFPDLGDGMVKVGIGDRHLATSPDSVNRHVNDVEWQCMEARVSRILPTLVDKRREAAVCLYTQTPDSDFVIDWHPEMQNVLMLSCCSGHGFKHSAAIGELVATIVQGEWHPYDVSHCKISRFEK